MDRRERDAGAAGRTDAGERRRGVAADVTTTTKDNTVSLRQARQSHYQENNPRCGVECKRYLII